MIPDLPRITSIRRARFLPPDKHRRCLEVAHAELATALVPYWAPDEVAVAIEAMPSGSSVGEGLVVRSGEFLILVVPQAGTRVRWAFRVIKHGARTWRRVIPDLPMAIDTIIGVLHGVQREPARPVSLACEAAYNHSHQPRTASLERLQFYHALELTLEECSTLINRAPQRVARWFARAGLPVPSARSPGAQPRLFDRIRDQLHAGGKVNPTAVREGISPDRTKRIFALAKALAAAEQ